jgi:hypothetical protein
MTTTETITITTTEATTSIIIDCWPGFRVNEQGKNCVFFGCNYINQNNGWYGWYFESFYYIYERYGCTTTTPQTTELLPTTTMTTRVFGVDCLAGFIPTGHDCVFLGCDYIDQNSGLNGWFFDSYYFIYEMYGCTTPTPLTSGIFSTTTMTTPEKTTNFQSSYTTVCTEGSITDGKGGCYYFDSCEMLYGPCDCYARSECCVHDECPIACGPESSGRRNRRCMPPTTMVPSVVPEPTKPAHNKCVKK